MERVSRSREERRNELIAAAQALFLEKGYDNTAVSDIVKALGVAQGTFYYHFQSKEDVLAAVTERIVSVTEGLLKNICEEKSLDSSRRMKMAIDTFHADINKNKEIIKQAYSESNAALYKRLFKLSIATYAPILARIIEEGNQSGQFEVKHPTETAEVIIVIVEYYCRHYVFTEDHSRLQRILETIDPFLKPFTGR